MPKLKWIIKYFDDNSDICIYKLNLIFKWNLSRKLRNSP